MVADYTGNSHLGFPLRDADLTPSRFCSISTYLTSSDAVAAWIAPTVLPEQVPLPLNVPRRQPLPFRGPVVTLSVGKDVCISAAAAVDVACCEVEKTPANLMLPFFWQLYVYPSPTSTFVCLQTPLGMKKDNKSEKANK
uniref:Uncharacterized protein n=1 Tax=Echinococcus granulosus TaxID=6210 RepID=A0A068X564_ECHGR|nr:hypothetical protein EgrG_002064700 [Echinococcus granulosus]